MKVFNTGLNTFYRKYLFTNPNENQALIAATFETEYNKTLSELIEQLLFFDKISIKIYGENLALTVLINDLGLKQTLELVDEGVIEFILWTPMLATLVADDPNLMGKVNPIVSGNVNSAIHSQPDLSIKAGLQALRKQPDRGTRRDIERKVIKAYRIPKADFVHNAAAIVSSAYTSNKLTGVGMPKTKEIAWLDKEERFKLLGLGDDILETTILADLHCVSLENYRYYNISRECFKELKKADNVLKGMQELYKVEHLPDAKALIAAGKISIKSIIQLRRKSVARKFRAWLVTHTEDDTEYIVKQYIEEIAGHKGLLEKGTGKFIKMIGVYGIGIGVGASIDGIPGSIVGAGASKLLEDTASLGISMIDSYLLDGILKGWQPRFFISEYQKVISQPEKG